MNLRQSLAMLMLWLLWMAHRIRRNGDSKPVVRKQSGPSLRARSIGVALVTGSLIDKIRLEKPWSTEHFGSAYRKYQVEVSALIPLIF